ncbi:hypothetical protein V8E36_001104 [Tilletia maclaganii]
MNWHNPSLLVATRHNHDLRSVQSGKSGAAAAAYITSYTTKSEETSASQVRMINTVFDRMETLGQDASLVRNLVTRCVMQFGREKSVHAQQAATYVRDLGDTWESHSTVPMLSARLMAVAISLHGPVRSKLTSVPPSPGVERNADSRGDATERSPIDVDPRTFGGILLSDGAHQAQEQVHECPDSALLDHGAAVIDDEDDDAIVPLRAPGQPHQVDDYLHRGDTLAHLCFYDFIRFCHLVPLPKKPNKAHHLLQPTHPNHGQKCHRYDPHKARGIPRAIFNTFPRSDGTETHGDAYCAAMLAHFAPFTHTTRFKDRTVTYEAAYQSFLFSNESQQVMENWAALTECDDAKDADILLRRKRESVRDQQLAETAAMLQSADHSGAIIEDHDVDFHALLKDRNRQSAEVLRMIESLTTSGWFQIQSSHGQGADGQSTASQNHAQMPKFSRALRREWKKEMSNLEAELRARAVTPRASTGILASSLGVFTVRAEQPAPPSLDGDSALSTTIPALPTTRCEWNDRAPHDIIAGLILERKLTGSQRLAFTIAARHFFMDLSGEFTRPLRLLMHGEAGTGKTVVVRLLRELLEVHGKGNQILFVAPTGKAAFAIGGVTQHSSFNLEVQKRGLSNEELQRSGKDNFSANRTRYLHKTFGPVRWLFFDEVSMTSCEALAEIDQALRVGKEAPDEPFGGVNVLFAGDLCQLPPVGASPLYRTCSSTTASQQTRTLTELGRASWLQINEVVTFTEQMRMRDADMAAALSRLRLRRNTDEDARLFNKNVLKSATRPHGLSLHDKPNAIVLAYTNDAVRTLNHQKATAMASVANGQLKICAADDTTLATLSRNQRAELMNYNGNANVKIGLGRLPLYVGMPVVYRGPNQSLPLGITNGAFATVQGWDLRKDGWGNDVAEGVFLRFNSDSDYQLTDLPNTTLPISPTSSSFDYPLVGTKPQVINVKRKQLPFQPGFAMTIHSAQGITSSGPVVVSLCRGSFAAYVAASRATCKADLVLTEPVTVADLTRHLLPDALRAELERLDALTAATKLRHDHDRWRCDISGTAHPVASIRRPREESDPYGPATRPEKRVRSTPAAGLVRPPMF